MNKQKLALVSAATVAAVCLAVWAAMRSSQPALPTEPVAAGPQATYRTPDEAPATPHAEIQP